MYKCSFCCREFTKTSSLKNHQGTCLKNPKFIFSEDPIFINQETLSSIDYLKTYPNKLQKNQKIIYKCKVCQKEVIKSYFIFKLQNYKFFCRTHLQENTCLSRYGKKNVASVNQFKLARKETSKKKYGVDNPIKNPDVKSKIWKTRSREYHSAKMKDVWRRKTIQQREHQRFACSRAKLGLTFFEKTKIENKRKETCIKRYGAPFYQNSDIFKRNLKDNLKRSKRRYTFENEHFDSSWELALWIYAKDHNEEIIREPCSFEYIFENKTHYYFPDFLYKGKLIEIKGDHFLDKRTLTKLEIAKQNNVQILHKKDIQIYFNYARNKYKNKLWYRKYRNKI